MGKALYDSILVQPRFAHFFLKKLQSKTCFVNELDSLDRALHASMMFLKNYTGDVADLALTFTTSRDGGRVDALDDREVVELVPNGRERVVVRDTRLAFIALLSHFKLNVQIRTQTAAFLRGLQDVVQPAWLELFAPEEMQLLISGSGYVDVRDWRAHTVYNGWSVRDESEGAVAWFWQVVDEMSDQERERLLLFATSCSRAPLLGFSALTPKFCINYSNIDASSLPTAATCMNLLRMPRYASKAQLREKLMLAITSDSGFELS